MSPHSGNLGIVVIREQKRGEERKKRGEVETYHRHARHKPYAFGNGLEELGLVGVQWLLQQLLHGNVMQNSHMSGKHVEKLNLSTLDVFRLIPLVPKRW